MSLNPRAKLNIPIRRQRLLVPPVLVLLTIPVFVLAQTLFGSALLTEHEPPADAYWTLEEHNTDYPKELAEAQVTG